ncbi:MAG: hypothetical protein HYU66_06400, partial [Armatimonadetes bacterium]|nr:hypothetical protein [Armatimonadota bacterium]
MRPRINPGPAPRDVPSLVQNLNNSVPNDCVLVEMLLPSSGVEIGGRQLRDIPQPVAEALFTSSANGLRMIRDVAERIIPTDEVIAGVGAVMVEVVGEEGKKQEGGPSFEGLDMPGGGPGGPMDGSMMEEAAIRQEALQLFGAGPSADLAWLARPRPAARDPLAAALAALPRPAAAAPT